jgi:holo-[acyl-carrier protein] synthase
VINLRSGKPELEFTPALKAVLEQRRIRRAHLSLTDERAYAAATVILECDG